MVSSSAAQKGTLAAFLQVPMPKMKLYSPSVCFIICLPEAWIHSEITKCQKTYILMTQLLSKIFNYINFVLTLIVDVEILPMHQKNLAQLSSPLWARDIFLLLRHRVYAEMHTNMQNFSVLDLKT